MQTGHFHVIPAVGWQVGWELGPTAWLKPLELGGPARLQTLSALGELACVGRTTAWSVQLCPPVTFSPAEVRLLANGLSIACRENTQQALVEVYCPEPGILWGYTTFPVPPSLFAPEGQIEEDQHGARLQSEQGNATIVYQRRGQQLHFALAYGPERIDQLLRRCRAYFERALATEMNQELSARLPYWNAMGRNPTYDRLRNAAAETLIRLLRSPTPSLPYVWSASDFRQPDRYVPNELLALTQGWCLLDATVATDLINGALNLQDEAGLIPAWFDAVAGTRAPYPCWPQLIQAARLTWNTLGEPADMATRLVPALRAYWLATYKHFSPQGDGCVAWPTAQESGPAAANLVACAAPELAALLLAEAEALAELAGAAGVDIEAVIAAERQIAQHLTRRHWQTQFHAFRAYALADHATQPARAADAYPLLWHGIDSVHAERMLSCFGPNAPLTQPQGQAAFSDGPVLASQQILLMAALRCVGAHAEERLLAERNMSALAPTDDQAPRLPARLDAPEGAAAPAAAAATLAMLASRVLTGSDTEEPARPPSRLWVELNRYRRAILWLLASLLIIAVLGVSLAFLLKRRPPQTEINAFAGLADRFYQEGRYREAIGVLEALNQRTGAAAGVELRLANALYRAGDYDDAALHYENLRERLPGEPSVLFNLAATRFRLGEVHQAIAHYEEILAMEEGAAPEGVIKLATFARDLLQTKLSIPLAPEGN